MAHSVLEDFVREYIESIGGVWDEVEPQVYDLLLPAEPSQGPPAASQVLRLTFDPEAVPEHPGSQLASFGTPLVEAFLKDALRRGEFQRLYFLGLNLAPHDLGGKVRHALTLGPEMELELTRARALHFPQVFFWFEASFVSDQKEQDLLAVGMDLHYGRQMRHQDKLLDPSRLADQPAQFLPEASHLPLDHGMPLARKEALRTLGPMIHSRERELKERLDRQVVRMRRYYADLAAEAEASASRAKENEEALARLASRRQAIVREEALRVAELKHKSTLRVSLARIITLLIYQPKLQVSAALLLPKKPSIPLSLVWDPLLDALEAVPCPSCCKPTYSLSQNRLHGVGCPNCLR